LMAAPSTHTYRAVGICDKRMSDTYFCHSLVLLVLLVVLVLRVSLVLLVLTRSVRVLCGQNMCMLAHGTIPNPRQESNSLAYLYLTLTI
jgi:hypothetical protein